MTLGQQAPNLDHGLFERLFKTEIVALDNYRSRLFGLFSEEIVRAWGRNERAPYREIGRPTLWAGSSFATLDFTLARHADGQLFVAEQKAELAWAGYSQLRLVNAAQIARHRGKRAFDWFLETATEPDRYVVKVEGRPVKVAGAILVWGATTGQGQEEAKSAFGFADVLALEAMLDDLRRWNDDAWRRRVEELRAWTNGLFDALFEESTRDERVVSDG